MKVFAWLHGYPPSHNGGAEHMLHTMLRDLVRKGHEVKVCTHRGRLGYMLGVFDGVHVTTAETNTRNKFARWCDVMVTHLDKTRLAVALAHQWRRPLVHVVHNHRQLEFHNVERHECQLAVMNSEWIREAVQWQGPQIVVRPPVYPEDYETPREKARSITLINMSMSKGVGVLWGVAERMPTKHFIAVEGAYGDQVFLDPVPPNVEIINHTPEIKAIYARTRILLMPSHYESWGRVGVEAMASGIPVIAHPTPGLKESLGPAGIFCNRQDVGAYVDAIEALDEPLVYARFSKAARDRARVLHPQDDLDRWEDALIAAIERWRARFNGHAGSSTDDAMITMPWAPSTHLPSITLEAMTAFRFFQVRKSNLTGLSPIYRLVPGQGWIENTDKKLSPGDVIAVPDVNANRAWFSRLAQRTCFEIEQPYPLPHEQAPDVTKPDVPESTQGPEAPEKTAPPPDVDVVTQETPELSWDGSRRGWEVVVGGDTHFFSRSDYTKAEAQAERDALVADEAAQDAP